MKLRIAAVLAALLGASLPAATPLMPVEEIRPGMVGVGRTVFEGAELKEFKVQIIGVLRNVQGPRRDLILARLDGAIARGVRRRPGHERQPRLHRRPPDRRRLVLDRRVSEGADRRHHADRRDEGCDAAAAPDGTRPGAARAAGDAGRAERRARGGVGSHRPVRAPAGRRAVDWPSRRSKARSSARCFGRSRRRS